MLTAILIATRLLVKFMSVQSGFSVILCKPRLNNPEVDNPKQEKGPGYFSVESLARRMLVALSKDEKLFQSFKTFNHCVPFKTSEG
jgi:hypothetical protein